MKQKSVRAGGKCFTDVCIRALHLKKLKRFSLRAAALLLAVLVVTAIVIATGVVPSFTEVLAHAGEALGAAVAESLTEG